MVSLSVQPALEQATAIHRWRRWWGEPVFLQLAADVFAFAGGTLLYLWLRFSSGWFESVVAPGGWELVAIVGVLVGYWLLLFWLLGLYRNWYKRPPLEELGAVLRAILIGVGLLVVLVWGDSGEFYRSNFRAVAVLYAVILLLGVGAARVAVRALQRELRRRGMYRIPVFLVGNRGGIEQLVRELAAIPHWGYEPLGIVLAGAWDERLPSVPFPVVGTLRELPDLLERVPAEELLVSFVPAEPEQFWQVVGVASQAQRGLKILSDLYRTAMGLARIERLYGTRLLELDPELLRPWQAFLKRALDIVVSSLVLVLGAPVWGLIALAIWLDSGRPILFVQERVGKGGKSFRLYKFRTMLPEGNPDTAWRHRDDPRITRVGRWLRRTHLDEIPQLWNVLKGEMSLVGPRPERPYYVQLFTEMVPEYPRRHSVKPGITGWWQVCRRPNWDDPTPEGVRRRVEMDFYYIEHQSLALDLEILLRTLWVMLTGRGI